MGIKKFFQKAGNWVRDKFHKAKNIVKKFTKPVIKVVKKVTDVIDKTPLAPILNKVTGGIYGLAKKGIDLIPDGDVKDNATKFAEQAKKLADTGTSKVAEYQDKAKTIIDKGKQWIDAGQKIGGLAKQIPGIIKGGMPQRNIGAVKPLIP
jgi:hypothetical protein